MAARTSQAGKNSKGKRTAVYAGSFDPVTLGHVDVISRAVKLFDRLVIAIGRNQAKPPLFTIDERMSMISEVCRKWPSVEVRSFTGLAVDFARTVDAVALVRGLRTEVDFVYEMQMALMNRHLSAPLETIFIPTAQEFGHVSSSLVREVASLGGDVSSLVPPSVAKKISDKIPGL
jgi:pantetheine-phosphate adenylyltransferase